MFGQRTKGPNEGEEVIQENTVQTAAPEAQQQQAPVASSPRSAPAAAAAEAAPVAAPRAATPATVSTRRGVIDMSGTSRRAAMPAVEGERDRTLRVGKGLALAGEITSCDVLVIEGKVEAKLNEGKLLEITETGQFRGSVEIENGDIAGRFDGNLVVHGRLTVRSTGRISGMVKYGELEVSAGGQIIGEVQVTGGGAGAQQGAPTFKSAARFASLSEEAESEAKQQERKSA
jgi:cytoskeletal protein CcmA (bactofilin family)